MITALVTGRKPQQMEWAAIWLDKWNCPRRSKLVIMNHNPDALKYSYSAKGYIEALTQSLLPYWQCFQLFVQDEAGIYWLQAVVAFL
jgi:hypothetical protein